MLPVEVSQAVVTVGPSPEGCGGISRLINAYFKYALSPAQFVCEASGRGKVAKLLSGVGAARRLSKMLSANPQIRIVHIHTASKISFLRSSLFVDVARRAGRKVVLHIHGGRFREYYARRPKFVRRVAAKADVVVALGQKWKEAFEDEMGMQHVVVLPNIIDPAVRTEIMPDGRVHGLYLGAVNASKGVFDLVEAMSRRADDLRGCFVLHVGGHGDIDGLKSHAKRLGVTDMLVCEGWVDGQRKQQLLTQADIMLLASYAEGLPLSLLEGMSYGLPVVATTVGSIPEIVDKENGILIAPGDIDALGNAIVRLVNSEPLRIHLGRNALQRTEPHLPQAVCRELGKLYNSLTSSN